MTSPSELAQEFTGLDAAARQHLDRLMASWGLLADLSFSDLLLYVPVDPFALAADVGTAPGATGPFFVVFGQMRPTTSQTLLQLDLVGQVVEGAELPVVAASWEQGRICEDEDEGGAQGSVRTAAIPVRFRGEIVAVLSRLWSPTGGRRTGGLERAYLQLFDRFAAMVAAGVFPYRAEDEVVEEAPRVGDGVVILDDEERITFASPNAVNALHRLGILTQIVGFTLEELGIDDHAVASAFEQRLPVIEELERRGEVVVLLHCLPLVEREAATGAAVLLRDITDLRRRDRLLLSKDAAIREVHHRVKNNLQTISSLLRLQSRRVADASARDALLESERRIRAIALVHEILAREPGEQVRFDEIVPELVHLARDANVSGKEVAVSVVGDAGDLIADVATPLAVVVAELLQNAVEHAFSEMGQEEPRIDLNFSATPAQLVVEVADNGSGFTEGFDIDRTRSLGLAIVRDLVRSQLGGSITVANDHGAVVRLVIPLRPGTAQSYP